MRTLLTILFYAACFELNGQRISKELLIEKISDVIENHHAIVGVAVMDSRGKELIQINGENHFPMQSVYKFHLALAVLHNVDQQRLQLDQIISVNATDLDQSTHSPMREERKTKTFDITIGELLYYSVALSDNNACDILFKLMDGVKSVQGYLTSLGERNVSVAATESEMSTGWDVQFSNWTTPVAAARLLERYYSTPLLNTPTHDFLWNQMVKSIRGERIKGMLPEGTVLAHKAGTSARNSEQVQAAFNDIGIVMLPNGKHFSIAFFIMNSKESDQENAKVTATISKLVWEYFVQ